MTSCSAWEMRSAATWLGFAVASARIASRPTNAGLSVTTTRPRPVTGRGTPWIRGTVSGVMTAIGGIGHTLPYLVPDSWPNAFWIATSIACVIVLIELWVIAWIRAKYMDTPFLQAAFQIVVGGVLVFLAGIFIGSA